MHFLVQLALCALRASCTAILLWLGAVISGQNTWVAALCSQWKELGAISVMTGLLIAFALTIALCFKLRTYCMQMSVAESRGIARAFPMIHSRLMPAQHGRSTPMPVKICCMLSSFAPAGMAGLLM